MFSQPWSAWPRSWLRRGTILAWESAVGAAEPFGLVLVVVELIVRVMSVLDCFEIELRARDTALCIPLCE